MSLILLKRDGIGHFTGQCVSRHLDAQGLQCCQGLLVKTGDGTCDERDGLSSTIAGSNEQMVIDESKKNFKGSVGWSVGRNRGCRRPACRQVKWNVPPVIDGRTQYESHLANDLSPQMQCLACVLPCLQREGRPSGSGLLLVSLVCDVRMFLHLMLCFPGRGNALRGEARPV